MKRYLQCAEQQESASNFSKYCACHEKWPSWSILFTHETLFTMRGVTSVIVQTHQLLRLPRKMNLMIDPCHTWNAIRNARSNKCHCPNSPNAAPATQNDSHDWSTSHMKRYSPNIAPATQNDSPTFRKNFSKTAETSFTMRDRSEHDPSMKPSVRNPPRNRGYFSSSPQAFSIEKYNISRPGLHSKTHQVLHRPRKVTLELRQMLHLPRKMTLMIDPDHWWNVIYDARSNMSHPQTSPNAAPATQNDPHDWSTSDMKRYV